MAAKQNQNAPVNRVRQVIWAGLISLVLWAGGIIAPLDQLIWTMQARMVSFQASGEYVFVGWDVDMTDPGFPERRVQLAETIQQLGESGASRIYLDAVFDKPSTAEADAALNRALQDMNGNAYLVRNWVKDAADEDRLMMSAPAVVQGVPEVAADRVRHIMLGIVWSEPYRVTGEGYNLPGFSASLAQHSAGHSGDIPINYGFDIRTIPFFRLADLDRGQFADMGGKTVVVGSAMRAGMPNTPGQIETPASLIHIYGAETLKAGFTRNFGVLAILLSFLAALAFIAGLKAGPLRRSSYAVLYGSLPLLVIGTAFAGIRIAAATAIISLFIYGLFRLRARWSSSFKLVDSDTGLPTFAALEADRDVSALAPSIIVAKIHRFEEVRKTLPPELHSQYVLRIIDRMKAASPEAKIYLGPGHLAGWCLPERDPGLIKEHLEGLRALFSSPLQVGNEQVDVSITFGVDVTPSPDIARRLANAISAAERTTETYEPIQIAEEKSDEDLIWNISLQSRIDKALSNGEISLVYQPKVMVTTGELIGVEALVRWNDPTRGQIQPDHFIRQCENAGRMSQLTRHVLREACLAGNAFEDRGIIIPMAVNISATLLHERGIIEMVQQVLEETGFAPQRLTLEITETYRISNLDRASDILDELTALGPKISMDDFGVGAASLEALLRLPFAELKIDRMFISAMLDDPKARGIVRSILKMGKELQIIVVAEGVENPATFGLLRQAGCMVAQGFGISRPVPFEGILAFERQKLGRKEKLSI